MIDINGNQFITLADPIYINGRRVREVYANGELVYPSMPAGIRIIYPPYKFVYEVGEEIDYTGIEVIIINKDGSTFVSPDYPDGIIPFEELIFPAKKATGGDNWYVDSIVNIDGSVNALVLSCTEPARKDGRQAYYTTQFYKWIDQYDTPAYFSTYSESIVLATVYDGYVYVYGVTDSSYGSSTMWVWEKSIWWDYWGHTVYGKWCRSCGYEDRMSGLPESSVDPTSLGTLLEVSFMKLPVKWKDRYSDKTFQDSFVIYVNRETEIKE